MQFFPTIHSSIPSASPDVNAPSPALQSCAEQALELAHMGTYVWDGTADRALWSPMLEEILGTQGIKCERTYEFWMSLVHPDDRDRVRSAHGCQAECSIRHLQYRILRPDGQVRWVERRGILEWDQQGKPIRALGLIWDVTEKEIAAKSLHSSEVLFRRLSDSSPLGVIRVNPDCKVTYVNQKLADIWGVERSDFVGLGWKSRVHPEDIPSFAPALQAALESGQESDHQYRLLFPDGSIRWLYARLGGLFDAETQIAGAVGIIEDITDKRNAELERDTLLQEQTATLYRLDKSLQDVGRLQRAMLGSTQKSQLKIDVCFHPCHAAGGDFVCHYVPRDHVDVVLLTDVSGHDLKAAFLSAHAQGIINGMLACGLPVEDAFTNLNKFLLEQAAALHESGVSIAACALTVDTERSQIGILNYGNPLPIYVPASGLPELLGEHGGSPLGWFNETSGVGTTRAVTEGLIILWTDGLEQLAFDLRISAQNAAVALIRAHQEGQTPKWVQGAKDDVLVVCVRLPQDEQAIGGKWMPLLDTWLQVEHILQIDSLQDQWSRELMFAIPSLGAAELFDALLCTREAVLNGLQHGCRNGGSVRLSILHRLFTNEIKILVADPGAGHHFDLRAQIQDGLADGHRGLLIMSQAAKQLELYRNGATVVMYF